MSATTPNIQSVRDLAQIAETVLDAVGVRRERLAVALPDLAITTAVFPGRGRAPERELRQELASMLPYALVEARCDFWRGRHDEVWPPLSERWWRSNTSKSWKRSSVASPGSTP